MKLSVVFMLAALMQVFAVSSAQTLSISKTEAPLEEIINEIRKQTGYNFVYSPKMLKEAKRVTLSMKNAELNDVLAICFQDQPLTYTVALKTIAIKWKAPEKESYVPPFPVTGKVLDENSAPLPGAGVRIKGTTTAVSTDVNGNFTITAPDGDAVLVFSFIGYKPQEIPVANKRNFTVTLQPDEQSLEQVVVVGYGEQRKASVTAAIATVNTKELLQTPQANISNMLVGRLPGLIAVQRSGEPGRNESSIRIRGTGTFNGTADPLIMVDGVERPDFNSIDPNEIETVSILKDASATAIYGVRGANGVVLITTRQGKKGSAPSISYSGNYAVLTPTQLPKYLDSYDYARLINEATLNDTYQTGSPYIPRYSDADLELFKNGTDPIFHPNTDWMELFLRDNSMQTQHNLNVTGGTEKVQYFLSAGFFDQNGLYNYTELNPEFSSNARNTRYNFRSNLDFSITKDFSASIKFAGQNENQNYPGNSSETLWQSISWTNPLASPGLIDGKVIRVDGSTQVVNPFWDLLNGGYSQQFHSNLNTSVRLNHNLNFITKGLAIHGTVAYDSFYSQSVNRSKGIPYYIAMKDANGEAVFIPQGEETPLGFNETNDKNRRIYAESGINYSRDFGVHKVTGLVLYNQTKYYSPSLAFLVPNGYQGVVGRVTYNFNNRYMAEVNLGYNGTENFAKGKRFGFFPAYSLGWAASEEPFFPKNGPVSFLKFRGSYGEVGNDRIGGERFLYLPSSYGYSGSYYFGTVGQNYQSYQGSIENKIGNPDLTWERAKKSNIGLELNMFNSKLTFTGDLFREMRDNILANRGTIPTTVGANLPAYNLGKMRNEGWEAEIGYRSNVKEFSYWAKANYTYAHNKILFQDEAPKTYAYQNTTGNRSGQFFGLLNEGFYNSWEEINDPDRPVSIWSNNKLQPGDLKYKDVNGDGIINTDDRVPIGYSNIPEKIMGLSLGGAFKGFDFSMLFQGASNVSIQYFGRSLWPFIKGQESAKTYIFERWTQERYDRGEKISFPRLGVDPQRAADHNYQESDFWSRDADYIRLKNAEIGYSFNSSLLQRVKVKSLRVYANGSNLITWTDVVEFDPESPTSGGNSEITAYPLQKTFNLGLNIKF